ARVERFDDFRQRPPAAASSIGSADAERLRAELVNLKAELVMSAGWKGQPSRAGQRPPALDGVRMSGQPTRRLIELLGLLPPGTPVSAGTRVNRAEWHQDGAVLEIEGIDLEPCIVSIRAQGSTP